MLSLARQSVLIVRKGPCEGKTFAIEDGFVIGRDDEANINLSDPSVSRRHAVLKIEREGVRIADLETTNGLIVNKKKVKSHFLKAGDEILIGDTELVFSIPVDPAARRRNFLVMLMLVCLAGSASIFFILEQQKRELAAVMPINRELSEPFTNEKWGLALWRYPQLEFVSELEHFPRPWARQMWGAENPELGNRLYSQKVILDGYYSLRFFEQIDANVPSYIQFDIEIWDGLAQFHTIFDFSLTDDTLPRRFRSIAFTEEQVMRAEHPEYGTYEEGRLTNTRPLDGGRVLTNLAWQRCYVVGKRRYLITIQTNAVDYERVEHVMAELMENVQITPVFWEPRSADELIEEGRTVYADANTFAASRLPQRMYMAARRFADAANIFKRLPADSNDHMNAVRLAGSARERLQLILVEARLAIRENLSRMKFNEADTKIAELLTTIDDNDANDSRDDNDEWRVWTIRAKAEASAERHNRPWALQD